MNPVSIPYDGNAADRPVAVFVTVTDFVNNTEPTILFFSIHRSRRDALVAHREYRHQCQRTALSDNPMYEISDLIFDAIVVLPDRSLKLLKKTRIYNDDQIHPIDLEDNEIFGEVMEKIDDWMASGGAALCDHALNKQNKSK